MNTGCQIIVLDRNVVVILISRKVTGVSKFPSVAISHVNLRAGLKELT